MKSKKTITEALSEVNLVKKKLEHKKKIVMSLLVKPDHAKDPYESEGGTAKFLNAEFQSINDLQERLIALRGAISQANADNEITIGEKTMSIHDWLTWKREVAKEETSFINNVVSTVRQSLENSQKNPQCYEDSEGKKHLVSFTSMVDYPFFVKKQEKMSEIFENLDGQLSLKNATVTVLI